MSNKDDITLHDVPIDEATSHDSSPWGVMESRASQLDDVLNEKLDQAFHRQTSQVVIDEVAKVASEYSPIDLAHAVTRLPPGSRFIVYENLPDFDAQMTFIIETDSTTRAAVLRHLDLEEIKLLIEKLPLDEAVWVLDDMSVRRRRGALALLDDSKIRAINELEKHDRNSAARLMTNEFFTFTMDVTIGEVSQVIRNNPGIDLTRRVFVTDNSGELQGYVPARNLIVNSHDLPLRQVMKPVAYKVSPDASREEVVDIVERYKIPVLPVVDQYDFLEGVITYEDVVEAMEDIADETIARIAGTDEEMEPHDPIFKKFLSRAPWLLVTLCAGMINVANMSYFEHIEGPWFVFVFFFVPLITGMSGNVGLQCSTILVRNIATGDLSRAGLRFAVGKEVLTGAFIGVAFGICSGVFVFLADSLGLYHIGLAPLPVAVIVAAGLLGACLTATTLGVASPTLFSKIGIDPAVASGPIVTAFNDVLSTIMYFIIARTISYLFMLHMTIVE